VADKIHVERLIQDLLSASVYDPISAEKLAILVRTTAESNEIGRRERVLTEKVFRERMRQIEKEGKIRFHALTKSKSTGDVVDCQVTQFLGYGNMGPVFAVSIDRQPFALKIYSSFELQDLMTIHGNFGLSGMLQDLSNEDGQTFLSQFGQKILAKKPSGIYARCKKIVKIHNVGDDGKYIYVLMDLLGVDTLNRVDFELLGRDPLDLCLWAIDCAVGLCHLHVEERRLHLNIRPEAFVKRDVKEGDRLPRYSFFHFPKKYLRGKEAPSLTTEFVLVDHFDTSVKASDRDPKGLGTVGSWLFVPPENILQMLKALRQDHTRFIVQGEPLEAKLTVKLKRSQMDDIWALGLTLYQFLSGGRLPFKTPTTVTEMINSVLLSKFDFSPIPTPFRRLLEAMLEKEPPQRLQRLLDGCPDNIRSRKVMAEAVLYKLEIAALESVGK
jgi:serine/threonine protein kinase